MNPRGQSVFTVGRAIWFTRIDYEMGDATLVLRKIRNSGKLGQLGRPKPGLLCPP
jgi:hypothetical protein